MLCIKFGADGHISASKSASSPSAKTLYETIDQRNAEKEMRKTILLLLFPIITFSQVKLPSVPQPNQFPNYQNQSFGIQPQLNRQTQ